MLPDFLRFTRIYPGDKKLQGKHAEEAIVHNPPSVSSKNTLLRRKALAVRTRGHGVRASLEGSRKEREARSRIAAPRSNGRPGATLSAAPSLGNRMIRFANGKLHAARHHPAPRLLTVPAEGILKLF